MAINNFFKISIIIFLVLFSRNGFAQEANKDVTITASGSGATLEDAKQSALRSATEQAFGAFISSKTEIFNDQVVADQMSSVSSGNIKSYEVLNEAQLPDGRYVVTLRSIVSVDKLTSFVQAKGVEIEIKGDLFASDIKQQILNEEAETQVIFQLMETLHKTTQLAFDYEIVASNPISLDDQNSLWGIPLIVYANSNSNLDICANIFKKTLSAINMKPSEITYYTNLNKKTYKLNFTYQGIENHFILRRESSLQVLDTYFSDWHLYSRLFEVSNNNNKSITGNDIANGIIPFEEKIYDSFWTWEMLEDLRINGGFSCYREEIRRTVSFDGNNKSYNEISVVFPESNQLVSFYEWVDKMTFQEVSQLDKYKIRALGIVSNFKNGGYVLFEENGHGIVVCPFDLNFKTWQEAQNGLADFKMNGIENWNLPTIEQFQMIQVNWETYGFGNFSCEGSIALKKYKESDKRSKGNPKILNHFTTSIVLDPQYYWTRNDSRSVFSLDYGLNSRNTYSGRNTRYIHTF